MTAIDLSQICPTAYSKPRRAGQMDTNRINGLDCVVLPGIVWICAKLELKIRCPQGRAGSSPAPGTSNRRSGSCRSAAFGTGSRTAISPVILPAVAKIACYGLRMISVWCEIMPQCQSVDASNLWTNGSCVFDHLMVYRLAACGGRKVGT